MKRVAIVGLGLIGKERLRAVETLRKNGRDVCAVGAFDPFAPDIDEVVRQSSTRVLASLEDVIAAEPDLAVVAVPHDVAAETVGTLLDSGIRVLLEKPLGRSLDEARAIARRAGRGQLLIGHNYRFFEGVAAMTADVARGAFGRPIGLTLVLGHGGAPRDKQSWKLDPIRAGGGCLIDPGIHLIDLARLMNGEKPSVVAGVAWSGFWGTGIEEDCRFVLSGAKLPQIDLHVSVVRWRSTFRLEVLGDEGYGIVEGRGRSYGPQTYRRGRRWGWQSGVSQKDSEELAAATDGEGVFAAELDAVLFESEPDGPTVATVEESLRNMELLESCRVAAGLGRPQFVG